jgi:hypothetical protein
MKTLLLALSVITLTGCVWTSNFDAKTLKGAECKQDCAQSGNSCYGSPFTCDKARSYCYSSCKELDDLAAKESER